MLKFFQSSALVFGILVLLTLIALIGAWFDEDASKGNLFYNLSIFYLEKLNSIGSSLTQNEALSLMNYFVGIISYSVCFGLIIRLLLRLSC